MKNFYKFSLNKSWVFHFTLAVIHDFALYCLIIPIKNGIINASKNFMCARVCWYITILLRCCIFLFCQNKIGPLIGRWTNLTHSRQERCQVMVEFLREGDVVVIRVWHLPLERCLSCKDTLNYRPATRHYLWGQS